MNCRQVPLPSTTSLSLLKFMSIESVMLSNHLILCSPLLLLPSIFGTGYPLGNVKKYMLNVERTNKKAMTWDILIEFTICAD